MQGAFLRFQFWLDIATFSNNRVRNFLSRPVLSRYIATYYVAIHCQRAYRRFKGS